MTKEQIFICSECGFSGSGKEFDRHIYWPEYNFGHGNAEPEDSCLKCPQCGAYGDEIEEAESCEACSEYYPACQLRKDGDERICEGCLSYRQSYDIRKKGDTND
jgi:hypothetical protein